MAAAEELEKVLAILPEGVFYKTVPATCYQEFPVELAEVVEVLMAILP
jgi:hypothetical protein